MTTRTTAFTSKQRILALGGLTAGIAAVTFGVVVLGGAVSVAATDPHSGPVEWILETTMESSVRAHASDVEVPEHLDLHDRELAERAFGHYSVACTPCHGAPGIDPAPWLVLNPPAESLAETAARWSDAELYWIVKHGIKMTGMPALGPTHGDDDLWAIAAFVRQLPEMTPEVYSAMAERHAARHGQGMAAHVPDAHHRHAHRGDPAADEP
jgi:mono/diheme cytochrome c family protein